MFGSTLTFIITPSSTVVLVIGLRYFIRVLLSMFVLTKVFGELEETYPPLKGWYHFKTSPACR